MSRCPGCGSYMIRLLLCLLALGTSEAVGAQVGQVAQWSEGDADGWRLLNLQTGQYVEDGVLVVDGSLEWRYLSEDSGDMYRVSANVEASNGDFVGDYFDGGVATLIFELYASVSTELNVDLWHATDLLYYTAQLSVETGWQRIQIPINSDNFSAGFGSADNLEVWIRNIGEVLIGTSRGNGAGEQIFRLRNVVLKGSGAGYAAWIQTYIDRNGGSLAEWLPGAEFCGDRQTNADKHVLGNDPTDPEEKLLARLTASPMELRWSSRSGRAYSVWRSTLNGDSFCKVPESDIAGTGSEVSFSIDEDSLSKIAVYRIEVKLE